MPKSRKRDILQASGFTPWRGLSLWQPLATLTATGYLPRVMLAWGTSYRGPVLIHASMVHDEDTRAICNSDRYRDTLIHLGYGYANRLPTGAIVGIADVADCGVWDDDPDDGEILDLGEYRMFLGKHLRNRYVWEFTHTRFIDPPIPVAGLPGLFRLPLEIGAKAAAKCVPSRPGWTIAVESGQTIRDVILANLRRSSHAGR